jgi:hypothetical protein
MKNGIFLFLGCFLFGGARGQGAAPQARPDTALMHFFVGHWAGKGEFANGKPIEADVEFRVDLDSSWLVYDHRDRAPNSYRAHSMWSVDRSKKFEGYTFDNFHGHREWTSNGWIGGKLILSGSEAVGAGVVLSDAPGVIFEHFIYERVSANQFKMTYEVSGDGIKWQVGDWLVFTRVP